MKFKMADLYNYLCVLGLLHLVRGAATAATTCTYLGNTHHIGDTWVDAHACDVCECSQYGVQCRADLDGGPCKLNKTIAIPGDHACVYAQMHAYLVGDVFTAVDGCNKCLCTEQGMQCTAKACNPEGFAQGTKEPLYGHCVDGELWYKFHSKWRATDGCNTCYCYTIGNYRGQHVCTTSTCKCEEVSSVITG